MEAIKRVTYDNQSNRSIGNAIILGDNCEVCDELMQELSSAVKCIYIDPPYNNGETYSYYTDSFAHDQWLKDMYKILVRLRGLLMDEGSIWISIDDNEVHYLKVLCDEVFGRRNFVTTIVWEHRTSRENRNTFSNNHEYILVYAKNPVAFKMQRNLLPLTDSILARYKNPDNDPRGDWQSVSLNAQAGHAVSSQFYTIKSPSGKEFNPPNGRCWIYNEARMIREISMNNVWFGKTGNNAPRLKKFLSDSKLGVTPETLWDSDVVGTTNDAKKHLLSMFPSMLIFDTPKPEALIKRIIEIGSNEQDLVLDAFLGSGTTATVAHKLNRRYIGIDNSKESINYSLNRLNKVIAGESGGISQDVSWDGGGTFSYYELTSDNIACDTSHVDSWYEKIDMTIVPSKINTYVVAR